VAATKGATRLPVIVNGDIDTADDVRSALARSGADGVMIGRAACGRPWRLGQVARLFDIGRMGPAPDLDRQHAIVQEHYEALLSHYGTRQGVRIARKHLSWYVHGLPGATRFREAVMREDDPGNVRRLLAEFYASAQDTAVQAA
jgi:tRNA-dihydrouridine synthase B